MKYKRYSDLEKQRASLLYQTHTVKEIEKLLNIPAPTIWSWVGDKSPNRVKVEAQTVSHQVNKLKRYLLKKHNALRLTTKQAFDEIGTFKRGRELGEVLNTKRLPSLGISDIARYIVLYT